jgi:arsenite/tail-anchored protein-transporting ATPase
MSEAELPPPIFLLFGGKGGVGKTTMATATAIDYATKHPDKRVLLFTTDPAPSLSDSISQRLDVEPVQIKDIPNLWGMEINAQHELEEFRKVYGDDILDILQQGTYLSDEETEQMFSLDIPGIDEVMGLKKIMDFMGTTRNDAERLALSKHETTQKVDNGQGFDIYILDTAPTGHTLRLLSLPDLLDNWIKFLAELRWKYHYMKERLSRGKDTSQESADQFLLDMKKTVKQVRELLVDPKRTRFVVVTTPEAMVIAETEDLLDDLSTLKVPVDTVIVNHVFPVDDSPFVQSRRSMQQKNIKSFKKSHPTLRIVEVEERSTEAQGLAIVGDIGSTLNVL